MGSPERYPQKTWNMLWLGLNCPWLPAGYRTCGFISTSRIFSKQLVHLELYIHFALLKDKQKLQKAPQVPRLYHWSCMPSRKPSTAPIVRSWSGKNTTLDYAWSHLNWYKSCNIRCLNVTSVYLPICPSTHPKHNFIDFSLTAILLCIHLNWNYASCLLSQFKFKNWIAISYNLCCKAQAVSILNPIEDTKILPYLGLFMGSGLTY